MNENSKRIPLTIISLVVFALLGIDSTSPATANNSNSHDTNKVSAAKTTPGLDAGKSKKLIAHRGGCASNHKTHVRMCVAGTYKYQRRFKVHGHWVRKNFWGARVTTQRCNKRGCWGPTKHWPLPPRYHYGKPVRNARSVASRQAGGDCPMSMIAVPMCKVPWSWWNRDVDKVTQTVNKYFATPCAAGALLGYGGAIVKDGWVKVFLESGVMTEASGAARIAGPEGWAVVAAAGCTLAVAAKGGEKLNEIFH